MAQEIQEREKHSNAILQQLLALRRLVDRNMRAGHTTALKKYRMHFIIATL